VQVAQRKLLVFGLLGAFATQGALVYGDTKASRLVPLNELEMRGRSIYLRHNCAACHQIYGFGGFLGPDLTNAAQRVPRARLVELLTAGNRQMPAFGLGEAEIDAVEAYLRAIDRTGTGVARQRVPPPVGAVTAALQQAVAEVSDPALARGHQVFSTFCASCHVPLRANPLGPNVAPDPTGIAGRLDRAQIDGVLAEGRVARGMPPAPLTAEQRADVVGYLLWLRDIRADLVSRVGDGSAQDLPWWEFR
jgi:nitric oxide reductase subunit C